MEQDLLVPVQLEEDWDRAPGELAAEQADHMDAGQVSTAFGGPIGQVLHLI